jgi:hypothetical protein
MMALSGADAAENSFNLESIVWIDKHGFVDQNIDNQIDRTHASLVDLWRSPTRRWSTGGHMYVQVGLANSRLHLGGSQLATGSYCMWYQNFGRPRSEAKGLYISYRSIWYIRATHACVVLTAVDHPRLARTVASPTSLSGVDTRKHGRGWLPSDIFWDSLFGSFCHVGSSLKRLATYMQRGGRDSRGMFALWLLKCPPACVV